MWPVLGGVFYDGTTPICKPRMDDVIVEVRHRITGQVMFLGAPSKGETLILDFEAGKPTRLRCDITDLLADHLVDSVSDD
jgi:hypothetical protein